MPPKKRTAGPGSRSKRLRSLPSVSDLQEAEPAAIVQQDSQSTPIPGLVQLNLQALTSTIVAALSVAVKDAMATQHQASAPGNSTTALGRVEHLVDETSHLTQPTGMQGMDPPISTLSAGDEPRQLFTSIGVNLGARVSSKTKAKIWAHEYIDFGALLSVAPPRERYA